MFGFSYCYSCDFVRLLDSALLDAYISELTQPADVTAHKRCCLVAFNDVLALYTELLHFLRTCSVTDDAVRADLLNDPVALKHITKLLSAFYRGTRTRGFTLRHFPFVNEVYSCGLVFFL